MKKVYFISAMFICILTAGKLQAQCFPVIPSNVQVISPIANDSSMDHPGPTHHVCFNGMYYYYNNNPDTIYLDGSAILTIGFCYNLTIYMRNNSQLHIDTTTAGLYQIKKIVYDTAYTWLTDTVWATVDSAIACPGMSFNYANFPGGISPCLTLGDEEISGSEIKIYPTITNGELMIESSISDYEVNVVDMMGRIVLLSRDRNSISIGDQSPGLYVVNIRKDGRNIITQKVFLVR